MVKFRRLYLPEIDSHVFVRPMDDVDRELLAVEWAAATAPWTIGFPSPPSAGYITRSLILQIAMMAAVNKSGKPIFIRHERARWLEEFSWGPEKFVGVGSMLWRIADVALVISGWVPRGKNPISRFLKKFSGKYFPDQEPFQYALASNRLLADEYRTPAVEALVEAHPKPIHNDGWNSVEEEICGRLDGRDIGEQIRAAAAEAAFAAFHEHKTKRGKVTFLAHYRVSATAGMEANLPIDSPHEDKEGKKRKKKLKNQKTAASLLMNNGYTAIPHSGKARGGEDVFTASLSEYCIRSAQAHPLEILEREEMMRLVFPAGEQYPEVRWEDDKTREKRVRKYDKLSAEDQLDVAAYFRAGCDYEAAARDRGIPNLTMRKRISRIIKSAEKNPQSPTKERGGNNVSACNIRTYKSPKIVCHK